tara:strand:- start:30 stop:317 length:288 start_codon:yes stop_codon:yes gene_type:complete
MRFFCGGCGSVEMTDAGVFGVFSCDDCGGLLADNVYLGSSYALVSNSFYSGPLSDEELMEAGRYRYYDLTCLGSAGITRRHGWFDSETKTVVSTG